MNLQKLSNQDLNFKIKSIVQKEREILSDLLLHVQEVNRRKLYLEMGYSSMFSYMTEYLAYSGGAAMRRIDAMRLLKEVPEVLVKLEEGKINLSQVSSLQQSIRQFQKQNTKPLAIEQKHQILSSIEGLNREQTESKIAQSLEMPVVSHNKIKHQADESVRIELCFSKEEWLEVKQLQALLSHSVSGDLRDLLLYMSKRVRKQKIGVGFTATAAVEKGGRDIIASAEVDKNSNSNSNLNHQGSKIEKANRVIIPMKVKREIFQRYKCCQYVSKETKRSCKSLWQLQVEHIKPVWAGGSNDIENLSLLCGQHNRYNYLKQSGRASG